MISPDSYYTIVLLLMIVTTTLSDSSLSELNGVKSGFDKAQVVNTDTDVFNLTEARQSLCPIVGYENAHYCPGVNESITKQRSTPLPPLQLPRGVGMTIDISTGVITLPALELTYSDRAENLWTDPYSKQSFIIPNEVFLTNASEEENNSTISIFKTEIDLVNVWTRNADGGFWTGGEFGVAKNVLDVYTAFFTENQATSVSQNSVALYILTMKYANSPSSLILNKYARAAVDSLTQTYDEEIYESFMNIWGTHIAVSTKVGGMKEQQAVFKNCIWSSPYFTGGLPIDELEKLLREDLLSQAPCNSYYLTRRKIVIDHLLGGNIQIQDLVLWKETIALNPALLKVIRYIPWYDVVTNGNIKKNLEKAITIRINASNIARMNAVDQITSNRTSLLQTQAQYGVRTNYYGPDKPVYELGDKIILGDVYQCPDGLSRENLEKYCNTGQNITACSVAYTNFQWITTWDVPLCYERNRTTGSFRAVARRIAGEILSEPEGRFRSKLIVFNSLSRYY